VEISKKVSMLKEKMRKC